MLLGIPRSARCVQRFDDSLKICNSHYLSHFAAFFIDARAKRSVVESCYKVKRRIAPKVRFIAVVCVYGVSPPDRCTSGLIVGRARPAPHRSTPAKAEQGAERDRHSQ